MDILINDLTSYDETEFDYNTDGDSISFTDLRADPGRIGLESVFREVTKLKTIQQLELPDNLFNNIPEKILKKYKLRAVSEDLRELRRHLEPLRYTLLSAFFWLRCREITDNLIKLLIQIIHRISVRAERKVEKEFINDFRRVNGKTNILFQMADAALNGENINDFLKESDLNLLGELPMISSICNLASKGYDNSSESLDELFNPIVKNILEKL